jgi:hypothetical protein
MTFVRPRNANPLVAADEDAAANAGGRDQPLVRPPGLPCRDARTPASVERAQFLTQGVDDGPLFRTHVALQEQVKDLQAQLAAIHEQHQAAAIEVAKASCNVTVRHGESLAAQRDAALAEAAQWKERAETAERESAALLRSKCALDAAMAFTLVSKRDTAVAERDAARAEVAALKARKVKLPKGWVHTETAKLFKEAIRAAGVEVGS